MKMCIRYCLFVLIFWFVFPSFSFAENEKNIDKILVISSYTPVKETGNRIISAFIRQIRKDTDMPISVEYMDSESFSDYNQWVQWQTSLFKAYEQPPRIVVIIGGEAWSVYREC